MLGLASFHSKVSGAGTSPAGEGREGDEVDLWLNAMRGAYGKGDPIAPKLFGRVVQGLEVLKLQEGGGKGSGSEELKGRVLASLWTDEQYGKVYDLYGDWPLALKHLERAADSTTTTSDDQPPPTPSQEEATAKATAFREEVALKVCLSGGGFHDGDGPLLRGRGEGGEAHHLLTGRNKEMCDGTYIVTETAMDRALNGNGTEGDLLYLEVVREELQGPKGERVRGYLKKRRAERGGGRKTATGASGANRSLAQSSAAGNAFGSTAKVAGTQQQQQQQQQHNSQGKDSALKALKEGASKHVPGQEVAGFGDVSSRAKVNHRERGGS